MSRVSEEKLTQQEWFLELAVKVAKHRPWTRCIKKQKLIPTITILRLECLKCPEFILNDGICDPL